jgi:hypothetical protein
MHDLQTSKPGQGFGSCNYGLWRTSRRRGPVRGRMMGPEVSGIFRAEHAGPKGGRDPNLRIGLM